MKFILCSIEKFTLEFPILLKTICTMLIYPHEEIDKQRKRVYLTLWLRLVYGRAIEFDFTLNENVEDMNKMVLDPVCSLMHWITFTTASMKKKTAKCRRFHIVSQVLNLCQRSILFTSVRIVFFFARFYCKI